MVIGGALGVVAYSAFVFPEVLGTVLEQALADGYQLPGLMLAFGPGLSIESLAILPDGGG